MVMPKDDPVDGLKQLKQVGVVFAGVVTLLGFGIVGHCTGTSQGLRSGHLNGREACRKEHQAEYEKEQVIKKQSRKIILVKEQAVFDFETCTVSDTTKALAVTDIRVVRALENAKLYEVTVCETGRYWYNCRGYSCRRERRRDGEGNRINDYGHRIPER